MQRTVPSIKPVFHGRTLKVSIAFATVGASKRRKASRCSAVSVVAIRSLPLYVDLRQLFWLPLPGGRERVKLRPLRRRRRGERAPVKLGALCRHSRRGREQKGSYWAW